MKRFIACFLAFCLLILCCGCAGPEVSSEPDSLHTETSSTEEPVPTAVPEPTPVPTPAPLFFTVDPHKLPADQNAFLEEAAASEAWSTLIEAVYLRESTVTCPDADAAKAVSIVFSASPYAPLAELTVENKQIHLVYSESGSPDEVDSAVCTMIQTEILDTNNTLETMLKLYRSVSGFEYTESEDNTLYRVLVEQKGGPKEIAAALQFLFAQLDIPAWLAEGDAGGMTHYWVIAEHDGILYHFDPVFENGVTAGRGLSYFGMSDAAHTETGCKPAYSIGFDRLKEETENLCVDFLFDDLFAGATDWTLDEISHTISLTYDFDTSYLTQIRTEE